MRSRRGQSTGVLQVLFAVLSLSIAPVLVKLGLAARADPVTLLAARLLLAAIALWSIVLLFRPSARAIDRTGLLSCALVAISNGSGLLCFYIGLTRIDASVAHVIFALFPAAALLLLATRGEKVTSLSLLRLGLGFAGIYLLVGLGSGVDMVGAGLVLIAAILYALHMVLIQWRLKAYPSETVTLYVITFMAFAMVLARIAYPLAWQPLPPVAWVVIVITALVSTVLARLLLFAGVRRIGGAQAALLGPVETLLTVTWASLLLGERLSPQQMVGGLLVLASAVLAAAPRGSTRDLPAPSRSGR